MAKVTKYQAGGVAKKDDFAKVMGKTLNSTTPGMPGYRKPTAAEIAKADKQAASMRKLSAAGKPYKAGGKVKAKDGKWIQKAVNPAHKGYCTPMTKATCTPKRKALAKTFKAMGRARKGK